MTYIFLAIITVLVYLIYKKQNPPALTPEQISETLLEEISRKEDYVERKIGSSHLKEYLTMEKTLLQCGSKNFLRLRERFKHDEQKYTHILKDWNDYLDTISECVFESEMLDVCSSEDSDEHYKARDLLFIKIQEAEKRFKELLGEEYSDPDKILNPKSAK